MVAPVPDDIYALSSRCVDELVAAVPTLATYLGIPGHDHRWNDFSLAGREGVADMFRNQLRRVRGIVLSDDPWQHLARDVAVAELERNLEEFDAGEHLLDLNSLASGLQDMRDAFDQMDQESRTGWENIASRLHGLPKAVAGYCSLLEDARTMGSVVARRQVVEAIRQARNHAGDGSHFATFPSTLAATGVADDALAAAVAEGVGHARKAFNTIADYLENTYLAATVDRDAVGEDRYVRCAKHFLGSDLDPRSTYEWGWSEVKRLRDRMTTTAEEILAGGGIAATLELLLTDPGRRAQPGGIPRSDAGPSGHGARRTRWSSFRRARADPHHRCEDDATGGITRCLLQRTVRGLHPPRHHLVVEGQGPAHSSVRRGDDRVPRGVSGPSPPIRLTGDCRRQDLPHAATRRLVLGFGEGWALYSEDLMEELGYLEKPDYVLGKLASEMLRACRVVIDIGSHLELPIPVGQPFHPGERWNFDTGVEMLERYAGQNHDISVSEMNRYLGWPGQAISYKVGQQAIRDLRSEAQRKPGFDMKRFHARLLEVGAVGLDVLRAHVRS